MSTGAYVLTVSNCGMLNDVTITGDVVVRNPYGYLPGTEIHKVRLYRWFVALHVSLLILWAALVVRWRREVLPFHCCIFLVLLLGLGESALHLWMLSSWNRTGFRSTWLLVTAQVASSTRSACALTLLLAASSGWSITSDKLDPDTLSGMKVVAPLCVLSELTFKMVGSFRF